MIFEEFVMTTLYFQKIWFFLSFFFFFPQMVQNKLNVAILSTFLCFFTTKLSCQLTRVFLAEEASTYSILNVKNDKCQEIHFFYLLKKKKVRKFMFNTIKKDVIYWFFFSLWKDNIDSLMFILSLLTDPMPKSSGKPLAMERTPLS